MILRIEAGLMHGLAHQTFEGPELRIAWDGERVCFGSLSLPAQRVAALPSMRLPIGADDQALLRAMMRQSSEDARRAGYPADRVIERWNDSLDAAAEAMAWTGIEPSRLRELLTEELKSR